jgi:hypothetical protein
LCYLPGMSWWPESGLLRAVLGAKSSVYAFLALACAAIVALAVLDVPFLSAIPPAWLGGIVALGLLAAALFLGRMWDLGHGRLRVHRRKRAILAQLDKLSASEEALLRHQAERNEQSFNAYIHSPVVGLQHKGLTLPSSSGYENAWPHTIPDFVWAEMRRRWPARDQPEEQPEDIRSALRRARADLTGRRGG